MYQLSNGMVDTLRMLPFRGEVKFLLLSLLLLVGCVAAQVKSAVTGKNQYSSTTRDASRVRLQVTPILVKTFTCTAEDSGTKHFAIDLRLTISNIGDEIAIIDKRSFWAGSRVSSNMSEADKKKYVLETRSDMWGLMPIEPKNLSEFAILKPGETYDFEGETRVSFLVSYDDASKSVRVLRPGSYLLQGEIATWPYLADPQKFHKIWREKGYLWFHSITTEPMPFTVKPDHSPVKCS